MNIKMNAKAKLLISYFAFLYVFILLLVAYSVFYYSTTAGKFVTASSGKKNIQYAALPEQNSKVSISTESREVRVDALDSFFAKHSSPLEGLGSHFVAEADKHELDFRLLPSIAMQESNLCKKTLDSAPFNCWGFGIYGQKRTGFESYEQAVSTISKTLAEKYIAYGYVTPEQIMSKYAPNSNGSWANAVYFFMNQIDTLMF